MASADAASRQQARRARRTSMGARSPLTASAAAASKRTSRRMSHAGGAKPLDAKARKKSVVQCACGAAELGKACICMPSRAELRARRRRSSVVPGAELPAAAAAAAKQVALEQAAAAAAGAAATSGDGGNGGVGGSNAGGGSNGGGSGGSSSDGTTIGAIEGMASQAAASVLPALPTPASKTSE